MVTILDTTTPAPAPTPKKPLVWLHDMPKRIMCCSRCGGENIKADAYAEWDVKAQDWVLSNTFEKGSWCDDCDGETRIEERAAPIEHAPSVLSIPGGGKWCLQPDAVLLMLAALHVGIEETEGEGAEALRRMLDRIAAFQRGEVE